MPTPHHTILFFTPDPPGAIWQDKPQIARRLARSNTVVYAGPEPYLFPLRDSAARLADLRRPALAHVEAGLYHFTWSPFTPITGAPIAGPLTASLRRRRWHAVLRQLSSLPPSSFLLPPSPILWLFRPGMLPYVDEFDAELVIYHVVDEYSAYPGLSAEQAAAQRDLDRRLTARADLVFCTAQSLVDARLPLNPNTHYMPNAVDYDAFQQAISAPPDSQASPIHHSSFIIPHFPRPLLGIVGGINAKVDLGLLAGVAERRPDWTLALVGPVSYGLDAGELERLRRLPNVHFAGPVPPEQVPAVIANCDVCLIPYRLNEQTRHVNPLKVYEYLAAGKPVVATALPELAQFEGVVRVAGGEWRVAGGEWRVAGGVDQEDGEVLDSFVAAVEAALAEADDPAAQAARRAIAAANTWDHRVARMLELIEEALARKERRKQLTVNSEQ